MTACTPGTSKAGLVSRWVIRACGNGLRSVFPQSMPSIHRSEENANRPCTLAGASVRNTLSPTPVARRLRVKVEGRLGAGMDPSLLSLAERGEDPAISRAAAQVPGYRLPKLELRGVDVAVEQVVDGHDHARDA